MSIILATASCSKYNELGETLDTQKAISISEALQQFKNDQNDKKVVFGRIKEVCQAEGCWFSYDLLDETIVVDFEDKFTVPSDIAKKNIYAIGSFYRDTTNIDAPVDAPDSARIQVDIKFRATGVRFK
jgi:hypothetical protein